MAKFIATYWMVVTKVIEADTEDDAETMALDDVPYPACTGSVEADVSSFSIEKDEE